jgi:N6-adenosine-specific RNA methylase IME4
MSIRLKQVGDPKSCPPKTEAAALATRRGLPLQANFPPRKLPAKPSRRKTSETQGRLSSTSAPVPPSLRPRISTRPNTSSTPMRAYAKQARNRDLEANAVEIRMRATRRLDEMRQAQAATVGLNSGSLRRGVNNTPRDLRPTLASQGIDKNLAKAARTLGAMDDAAFERKIVEARASAGRVFRRAVREVEIAQEREERRAQTAQGGSVADLHALIASGYRAGTIAVDPPWPFEQYSERAAHAVQDHYDTMTLDEIKALPVRALAADDCALFMWATWPKMPIWNEVIEAWGFRFSGLAFDWVKLNADGKGLHWGNGYNTRQNPEPCILAKRGNPLRLDEGVHSVIMAPVGEHSEKPDEAYARMERLYPGPRLELFARRERDRWKTWGDELPPLSVSGAAS